MKNANFIKSLAVVLGLLLFSKHVEAYQVFNVGSDWSDTINPNSPWSYNDSNGPINTHQSNWGTHNPVWAGQDAWAATATGPGHIVMWMKSDRTLGAPYDLQVGDVNTHTWDSVSSVPGTSNLSSLIWTAPSAGVYDFSGNVWQAVHINRSADVFVYVDGSPFTSVALFDGDGYTRAAPFSFAGSGISLAAGDTIDLRFITTSSLGTHVGVNLTVTTVPEPSTVLLMTTSLVGVLIYGLRRSKSPSSVV